ncbi:MAG: PEP-CTERM sorting domain-containing protein [Phycisphaeraceae bacterium]|nr:PEP-CTERM sorting domain-containing protein [Phycisphaeraceae bacterium]
MKKIALLALVSVAGTAVASEIIPGTLLGSATFTNKNSIDAVGSATNDRDSAFISPGGTVASIRAFGSLTKVNSATFASEARVRFSAGTGNAFPNLDFQATTIGSYTGTIAVDRTLNVTPFTLTDGGQVNFEWFESFQDGPAGLPESTWDTVTYEFRSAAQIVNGNFNLGAIGFNQPGTHSGSHVAGGLDFFTFSIPAVANPGDSLTIRMTAGLTGTSMTDTEIALYDLSTGNKIAENDDFGGLGLFSGLNFSDTNPLAAGGYLLVTGGFNTIFPANLDGAFIAGTNAGTYELDIRYVPTPGALALMGMGGLVAARRRRA